METLKKMAFIVLISLIASTLTAQSSSAIQAAFSKSYESETSGNYTAAISDLKAVYNKDSYIVNVRMGWLSYLAKQYTESIKYYDLAIVQKPYAIEARFGCVKPLSAIESWEKVKNHYIQILKIDPQNTVANYWLGVIYYNRKDYNNAANLFGKNFNLYPLDYDSVIMLAWSKFYLNKMADAKVLFNQALTLRPNDSSSINGLKAIK